MRIRDGAARVKWELKMWLLPETKMDHAKPLQLQSPATAVQKNIHVLVGVTGSVAALKLPLLVTELLKIPAVEVRVVTTERAKHFYNPQELPVKVNLYDDAEEWQLWKGRTDPVLHIDLRRWADLMLVAPLDANTLAKMANGICDNLLESLVRPLAFPSSADLHRPGLGSQQAASLLPAAMNGYVEPPITASADRAAEERHYAEIPCIVKKLRLWR
uniref:Uncharacterized protein n=1 Tax=Sphaerodactylus townsendi TaxID=933632 RepID=A0ACB8E5K5_9SAUR